ncbi:MAG: SDR family NAD(P)-dependent oxidoreductase, partial [Actinobacteria bacterium]|nr:SDR family NAD(P)-dependent oxidoreductase [Actinomycetota bacterium]
MQPRCCDSARGQRGVSFDTCRRSHFEGATLQRRVPGTRIRPTRGVAMPAETRSLKDSVVAITGATAGIGAATARLLVEAGAKVALCGRREERLTALVDELGAENAVGVVCDVSIPADNARLIAAATGRWGRIDSVIPNAGIGIYGGIMDTSDERLAEMMQT